jgi:hypothetical protein
MNREELKEKIAEVLRSHSTGIPFVNLSLERAEEILTVIEGAGCTICPNEPTDEQLESAADIGGASAAYWSMLSVSPFKKRGEKPA